MKVIEAYTLLAVFVIESNNDFIIIDINTVYKCINKKLLLLYIRKVSLCKTHNPRLDFILADYRPANLFVFIVAAYCREKLIEISKNYGFNIEEKPLETSKTGLEKLDKDADEAEKELEEAKQLKARRQQEIKKGIAVGIKNANKAMADYLMKLTLADERNAYEVFIEERSAKIGRWLDSAKSSTNFNVDKKTDEKMKG